MCVCVYICIYIYIYTHIWRICVYIQACGCIYIYIYTYLWRIYVCIYRPADPRMSFLLVHDIAEHGGAMADLGQVYREAERGRGRGGRLREGWWGIERERARDLYIGPLQAVQPFGVLMRCECN